MSTATQPKTATMLLLALIAAVVFAVVTVPAQAASPSLRVEVTSQPTTFAPNSSNVEGLPEYVVRVTNVGAADFSGTFTVTDILPPGITEAGTGNQTVTRTTPDFFCCSRTPILGPGDTQTAFIPVDVGNLREGSTVTNRVSLTAQGAAGAVGSTTTTISSADPPFDFRHGGQRLELTDPDGSAVTQAGSHPYQLTLDFGFATRLTGAAHGIGQLEASENGLRDLSATLPRGIIADPSATPIRCTEAQLVRFDCPDASQIGLVNFLFTPDAGSSVQTFTGPTNLYNMVPPPGAPAEFAFDAAGLGILVHITGGVRAGAGGGYSLTADTHDVLSKFGNSVIALETELWGDPSAPSHDSRRGNCSTNGNYTNCAVARQTTPLLTMPTACASTLGAELSADSWLHPGTFHTASFPVTDQNGDPTPVVGCSQLAFTPSIDVQPTSRQADSSAGVDADLQLPQSRDKATLATANLKKATIVLPEGVALNPSAADGLGACGEAQIGLTSEGPISFNGSDPTCPDASKVGSGTIDTPLLADPLDVDLYVADPTDNPFHTLLSGYLVAHGQGILIKLAGRFDRDPVTGQITATFDDNPQLPFSDLELHFKGGDRGILVTPSTCGVYTTSSSFGSWSAADPDHPTPAEARNVDSRFTVDHAPGGGACVAGNPSLPGNPLDKNALPLIRRSRRGRSRRRRVLTARLC